MATVNANTDAYGTLAAAGTDTVNFPLNYRNFWVQNTGANPMWIRSDGTAAVANADGTKIIPAGQGHNVHNAVPVTKAANLTVSVTSTAGTTYYISVSTPSL